MAGNPRKFSEKIAIQQRKLNEEKSEFETIMSEVSRITRVRIISFFCGGGGLPEKCMRFPVIRLKFNGR